MPDAFHVSVLNAPQLLQEAAEAIHFGLQDAGYDSVLASGVRQFHDHPGRRKIILAPKLGRVLREAFPGQDWRTLITPRDIVYNAEQLRPDLPDAHEMTDIFRERVIWDYSTANIAFLEQFGCPEARFVPLGYVRQLERIPRREPDADVMFYGSTNPRRQAILDALRGAGLVCRFHDQHNRVYGKERDALIAGARVILNLHYYRLSIFEVVRAFYPLINGKCVVSEDGPDGNQRLYQDAVVFTPYEAIVDTVVQLARDDARRRQQEAQAAAAMRQLPQAAILRRVLEGGA
ncbi:MAG: hypothetical protein QM692_05405 [Thermomicrobiales bacterium]